MRWHAPPGATCAATSATSATKPKTRAWPGHILAWLLWLLSSGLPAAWASTSVPPERIVRLDAHQAALIDLWPSVQVLADPSHAMDAAAAWRARDRFEVPTVPRANFGVARASVWLRVPLMMQGRGERWVLDIAYPALNEVDVYLVRGDTPAYVARMGSELDRDARPIPARTHAVSLTLEDGPQELLLRVRTHSSMVVPLSLSRPSAFYLAAAKAQLVQGLAFGVVCVLVMYALSQWVALRDPAYGLYAGAVSASSVFLLAYTGLGPQLLWAPLRGDVIDKIAPLAVLLALGAGSIFVARALDTRQAAPRIDRGLRVLCLCATSSFTASALGLLDYRSTQLMATALGPPVILLALPVAWRRSRQGDSIGTYMFIGWSCYAIGSLLMAGLLRGVLPAAFWSVHAYQIGALIEMLVWMRVLSLRTRELTLQAESALQVRRQLESQARTDALTGLANRRGLEQTLPLALRATPRKKDQPGVAGALLLLDLDGFKPINDTHGHALGDLVLQTIAQRLLSGVRAGDIVARLGGDEFVVFARGAMDAASARSLADKLIALVREPIEVQGVRCEVGVTIGFTLACAHDADDAPALLDRADQAMYEGKRAGRGVVREARDAPADSACTDAPDQRAGGVHPRKGMT